MPKTQGAPRARRSAYWLIARDGPKCLEVLTIEDHRGGKSLPVFSFEDEARLYLRLEEPGPGWRAEEVTREELFSVLVGPCAGVGQVALDPLPGVFGREAAYLLSLGRMDFMRTLARERESPVASSRAPLAASAWPDLTLVYGGKAG